MVTKTEVFSLLAHRSARDWPLIEGRRGRSSNAASVNTISARNKTVDGNLQKTFDRNSLIVIEGITSEPEKSLDQDSFITTDKATGDPERYKDARTQFVRTLYLDEMFERRTMRTTAVPPSSPQRSPQRAARRGKCRRRRKTSQQIRKRRQVDSKKTATERLKVKSPRANENRVRKERTVKRTNELIQADNEGESNSASKNPIILTPRYQYLDQAKRNKRCSLRAHHNAKASGGFIRSLLTGSDWSRRVIRAEVLMSYLRRVSIATVLMFPRKGITPPPSLSLSLDRLRPASLDRFQPVPTGYTRGGRHVASPMRFHGYDYYVRAQKAGRSAPDEVTPK